jgi:chemotaxis methyl-accepting protein methylase
MSDPASQAGFEALREKIYRDTGLDCSQYKENYLKRRIAARMRAVGSAGYAEYMALLDSSPDEYPKLKDRITVNVTEFFRDRDVYQYLRVTLLPALLERCAAEGRPLLIWSAGCSSGEEPYSLAAILASLGAEAFSILATDIDEACLARAAAGRYPAELLLKMDPRLEAPWFEKVGDEMRARPALRSRIRF